MSSRLNIFHSLSQIDCWTSFVQSEMSNCSAWYCQTADSWCGWFHFTFMALFELFLSSVTRYFTFINLTHQSCRHQGRIQEVTFFFFCWSCQWDGPLLGGFWRLLSHPEIKLSAAGPVPHCWGEHPDPNEVHVSSIKGPGCVSSSLT